MTADGSEPEPIDGDPAEAALAGGRVGGAVLVQGTVRRPTGPWTPP